MFKSLLDSGTVLAFGSDWPVRKKFNDIYRGYLITIVVVHYGFIVMCRLCFTYFLLASPIQVADINPLSSIKTAMERIPPGWENGWITSERISLREALTA